MNKKLNDTAIHACCTLFNSRIKGYNLMSRYSIDNLNINKPVIYTYDG